MSSVIGKKKGNQVYYYVATSGRVDGKPRIVHQTYLGTAERLAQLVRDKAAPVCCFQLFFVGFVPDSAVTKWLGNRTNLEWQAEATARQVAYSVQLTGPLAAIPFLQ